MENSLENEKQNKDVTILLPCLNEENVIGICVGKAKRVIEKLGICQEGFSSSSEGHSSCS